MNEQDKQILGQYDAWIQNNSDIAAMVIKQWLMPVEGKDAPIFPPTYNLNETDLAKKQRDELKNKGVYSNNNNIYGYNIDWFEDNTSVCQIDSVGSQANRMETLFLMDSYKNLVPKITIKIKDKNINILNVPHRAADAVIRFSNLWDKFERAFKEINDKGNAELLTKLAPTSIVFGVWDSRGTQAKIPRIVRSVVRAYNVHPLHRSAQYIPPVNYLNEGILNIDEKNQKKYKETLAVLGFTHVPAPWTHGGVIVDKEIRRETSLNLAALRILGCGKDENNNDKDPLPLRRYILGLCLIVLTASQSTYLREGCHLVIDKTHKEESVIVKYDGSIEPISISHSDALKYAKLAAEDFGIGEDMEDEFNIEKAEQEIKKSEKNKSKENDSSNENNDE